MNTTTIISQNKDYRGWIKELKQRYLSARLKATVEVNRTLLEYYWNLGRDIANRQYANTYGSGFFKTLSRDLRLEMPDGKGFSERNLRNMYDFYCTYHHIVEILQQPAAKFNSANNLQSADDLLKEIFSIPWDHQCRIISKCKGDAQKALFFVRKVIENNWGDLAQQATKDPYVFNFLSMTESYNERELETALVDNVTKFLVELGTGFAFMGRQYRLQVGSKEIFIDLLFYNTRIHAYCCIELKTGSFEASHLGQLGLYVNAVNHQLKTEQDNPTIGLLICKDKDNIEAQYSLESYNLPLGISQYELSKLIPEEIKGSLPSIEEIESSLEQLSEK